jgi:hypothetical protein
VTQPTSPPPSSVEPRNPLARSCAPLAKKSPVGFIRPCEPTLAARPPSGPGWLHEIKHDGFRILARKQGEQVKSGADAVSEAMYLDSPFPKWFTSEICSCTGVYR